MCKMVVHPNLAECSEISPTVDGNWDLRVQPESRWETANSEQNETPTNRPPPRGGPWELAYHDNTGEDHESSDEVSTDARRL